MNADLASALGHVRNAVWQLLGDQREDWLLLGLEGLELEALLNQDDIEPDVVPLQGGPADSLASARELMAGIPQQVPPAAWSAVHALIAKLS
jgi:hypothetical protein